MEKREYFWEWIRTEQGMRTIAEKYFDINAPFIECLNSIAECSVGCPSIYGFLSFCDCEYCEDCYRLSYRDIVEKKGKHDK